MTDQQQRYLELFLEEASEQIDNLNESLLRLEKEGLQAELVSEIFRSAHTLKSAAAFVGFDGLSMLAHNMEDLLQGVKDGKFEIRTELVNLFFQVVDRTRAFLSQVASGQPAVENFDDLKDSIVAYRDDDTAQPVGAVAESAAPAAASAVSIAPLPTPDPAGPPAPQAPVSNGNGNGGGNGAIEAAAAPATAPQSGEAPAGGGQMDFIALAAAEEEELAQAAGDQAVFDGVVRMDSDAAMKNMRYLMVLESLKREANLFRVDPAESALEGEADIPALRFIVYGKKTRSELMNLCQVDMVEEVRLREHAAGGLSQERTEVAGGQQESRLQSKNIKVSSEKIDYLMNNVGELVIINSGLQKIYEDMQNSMGESAALTELKSKIDQAERIARDLQSGIMKTRMIPVGLVFHRFTRPVRDLALDLNKEVELDFRGEETELDKNIIDALSEPLLHLLRNSLDHGIEHPNDRAAAGKPAVAKLSLNSYQSGNNIMIEISDDGRGLNRDAILKKAVSAGLVEADADLRDEEVFELIFNSGFSTSDAVTDISGRGVGMNVVKKMVEDFKGNIQIVSNPGEGTTFMLSFPLTLAIFSAIIVTLKEEEYAFPLADVVETIRVARDEVTSLQGRDIINLRGDILPVFRLGRLMGFAEDENQPDEFPVLIAMSANRKVGFIVDGLNGKREIVIKSLEQNFRSVRGLIGASIMGDGRIIMVVDVQGLLDMAGRPGLRGEVAGELDGSGSGFGSADAARHYNERVTELIELQKQSATEWDWNDEIDEDELAENADGQPGGIPGLGGAPDASGAAAAGADSKKSSEDMRSEYLKQSAPDVSPTPPVVNAPAPVAPAGDVSTAIPGAAVAPGETDRASRAAPLQELSEEDYKNLFSLINTGMTNAGGVLSQLLGVDVEVSVPEFKTMEYVELRKHIPDGKLLGAAVEAEDDMDAIILLVFDEGTGYRAAGDLMGVPQENWDASGISLEDLGSVLCELVNIVGASILNELSNKTGLSITPTVPDFVQGDADGIVTWLDGKESSKKGLKVLYITADFFRQDLEFLGRLFMIPSSETLARVVNKL
ncbi:MAG: chemotaxis protein CheW [bacterium]|nr:chemotaxis protein CheW [bacterium]